MSKDDEIRNGLHMAGVPDYALRTTLPKEGGEALRTLITSGAFDKQGRPMGVFIYPTRPANYAKARTLFYLLAKELFLSGHTTYCLPLTRLYEAISSDEYTLEASMVAQVRFVLVLDFYEKGAPFPLQPNESARLRTWVREKFEHGSTVCFLSDSPLTACKEWWPEAFTGFLIENTIVQGF